MSIASGMLVAGLVALVGSITSATKLSSPCPDIFHYDSTDQPNQWSGTLKLLSDADLHGVWARLIFSEKLAGLDVSDNFGEIVSSEDNKEYLIKNKNFLLKAGVPTDVKLTVKYDGGNIPTLAGYRLNAKVLCSAGEAAPEELYPGDLNNKEFLVSITSQPEPSAYKEIESCGTTPLFANHKDVHEKAQNGQWPWQAAIYVQSNNGEKYICEATLISSRHVITPAHCVTYLKSELAMPVRQLAVYVGKYSHIQNEQNKYVQKFGVEKIFLHPGYRAKELLNDLSIIRLDKPVIVGDYVRPICLKQISDGGERFLVGYEFNRDKIENLAHTKVNVLSDEECLQKAANLKGLLSDNVLCSSYVDGDMPCIGDSGSSLVTLRDGKKTVWELKGVITVGVALQNKFVCDGSSLVYAVDVANYLKWIQAVIL